MSRPAPAPGAPGSSRGLARSLRALGWLLSLACLLLLFVWVPVGETAAALLAGDPLLLLLAAVATTGNLALRGVRWMALLGRGGARDLRLATAISMVGLALNATIPGKVGEIARVGLAARRLGIRVGEAGMASLIERVIDLAVLSALGFATLSLTRWRATTPDGAFSREGMIGLAGSLLATSAVATAVVLAAAYDPLGERVRRALSARVVRASWRRRIRRFLLDVRNGAVRIRSRRAAVPALVSTVVLWAFLGASVYLVGLAMPGVECAPTAALAFAVLTTLASALPSAPGAWGVYEAAGVVVGSALVSAGSTADLTAFVIAAHAAQYVPVVVAGAACWVAMGRRSAEPLEDRDAGGVGPDRELGA